MQFGVELTNIGMSVMLLEVMAITLAVRLVARGHVQRAASTIDALTSTSQPSSFLSHDNFRHRSAMSEPFSQSTFVNGRILTEFDSFERKALEMRGEYTSNMRGFCIGTIPARLYIDKTMNKPLPRIKQRIPTVDFSPLDDASVVANERPMYKLFVGVPIYACILLPLTLEASSIVSRTSNSLPESSS